MKATELAEGDIDAALSAGREHVAAGRHADAEQIFRRVIEREPANLDAQIGLAQIRIETGRESDAIGLLSRVLLADARSTEAHLLAASAYERMGLFEDAADHVALVLAVDPDQPAVNRRFVTILERLGDTRGLIRCLRRIVASEEAEEAAGRAPGPGSDELETRTMLGITLSKSGQHDEALRILEDVAKRRGQVSTGYADLGMAALTAERLEAAVAALSRALELDPRSAQAHCGLGLCYQKMRRWSEAAAAFTSTEQLAPQLAVGPWNLGLALDALGDKAGARRALLRAAALEPNDRELRLALESSFFGPPERSAGGGLSIGGAAIGGAISGDLKTIEFLDLLEFLRLQTKTGALNVRSRRGAGVVRLVRGQITSASVPATARFDLALVSTGLLARGALEPLLARHPGVDRESAEALGTAIVREGSIERRQLSKLMSRRIHEALVEMLSWTEGTFSFETGEDRDPPAIFFNLRDVVSELVRVSDKRRPGTQSPAH